MTGCPLGSRPSTARSVMAVMAVKAFRVIVREQDQAGVRAYWNAIVMARGTARRMARGGDRAAREDALARARSRGGSTA